VVLHGSLTVDDYVPGRSDVDLLGVVDDPLSDAQVAALTEAVARQRPRAPGRVDLRVVTRQVAASPTPAPPLEAYLEITPGSGLPVERRHPGKRDLVVELSMCRAHGRSLVGVALCRGGAPLLQDGSRGGGRCGVILPSRWFVPPSGSAAVTRPARSTQRRSGGSWRSFEPSWPGGRDGM
jgi:hypothetical protein